MFRKKELVLHGSQGYQWIQMTNFQAIANISGNINFRKIIKIYNPNVLYRVATSESVARNLCAVS